MALFAVVGGLVLIGVVAGLTSTPSASHTTPRATVVSAGITGTTTTGSTRPSGTPPTSSRTTTASFPPASTAAAVAPTGVPSIVPMPNPRLTPGAVQSSDTAAICTPGWASAHRDVSYQTKDAVAAEYGISSRSGYEIDHLIPLELGGANTVANLWPEPYNSQYGAIEKDGLEDWLHEQVCNGNTSLAAAQHEIATNWYTAWLAAGKPMPSDFGYSNSPPGSAPTTTTTTSTTTATTSTLPPVTVPPAGGPPGSGPSCQVTASSAGNPQYPDDYDISVTSNQPNTEASASNGHNSYGGQTDSSGSVTILLYFTHPGDTITVNVGGASCSTTA